jgi:hypothetical protein
VESTAISNVGRNGVFVRHCFGFALNPIQQPTAMQQMLKIITLISLKALIKKSSLKVKKCWNGWT